MSNKSVSDFVAASMDAVLKSQAHKNLFKTQYKFASADTCSKCDKDMDSCSCDSAMADQHLPGDPLDPSLGPSYDNVPKRPSPAPVAPKPVAKPVGPAKLDPRLDPNSNVMPDPYPGHEQVESWLVNNTHKADDGMADDNDARKKKKEESEDSDSASADDNDAKKGKCKDCGKPNFLCKCDKGSADDNDARKKKDSSSSSSSSSDSSSADDEDLKSSAAFNVAIDSLITASAALDSVGMVKSATLSLQLASLVSQAKKKDKEIKKSKKDSKSTSSKDSNAAKDKAAKEKAAKEKAKEKEKRDSQLAKDKAMKEKEKAKEKAEKEKAAKEKAKSTSKR